MKFFSRFFVTLFLAALTLLMGSMATAQDMQRQIWASPSTLK